jgi:eukaryotic-like serine/threonine-protein kinase
VTHVISRLGAAIADRYRIERELGTGGMATVYLAEDVRHRRKVALKVLHPELSAVLGPERFLKEIELTASLQHPHILPLFDSGSADGQLYYVMPFVDGETLRGRLERERQLPLADAVRLATEVADALAYAHGRGVIHRDIKPENVLLQGGHALVADFGIALAVQHAGGQRMTQTGLSLGTPQYMSPEQAMGEKATDARTDVYALGAVTYEMLTGEPPFSGPTVQSIVAKVLTERPMAPTAVRDTIPPGVEHAVLTALAKLPADRFATAAAFATALTTERAAAATTQSAVYAPPRQQKRWLRVAVAGNVLLAAGLAALALRPTATTPVSRQQVVLWRHAVAGALTPGAAFVATQAAIAPDGSSIVYTDSSAGGWMLMRKRREASIAEPLSGAQGGVSPFFSPDGKWIGFITFDAKLKKVPAAGGSPITIAQSDPTGYQVGAWLDDGSIVYTSDSLLRVPSGGGKPRALRVPLDLLSAVPSIWPLPGSRGLLFTGCRGNCAFSTDAYVYDLATDTARVLIPQATGIWYSPTGHVLYTSRDGGLFAAAFDLKTLSLSSDAVPVVDGVMPGGFTLAPNGAALYTLDPTRTVPSQLMWVDRQGRAEPFDSTWQARFDYPALSPDGRSLAVSQTEKTTELYIRRADGSRQKVSAPGAVNWRPAWLADGRSLLFVSVGDPEKDVTDVTIHRVGVDGSATSTLFLRQRWGVYEAEVSADSQWLVYRTDEPGGPNIYARRLHGDTSRVTVAAGSASELQVALSPNHKWVSYTGTERNERVIVVASFPDGKVKRVVSRGAGSEPRWARSGRELFFESGGQLQTVSIMDETDLQISEPRTLFSLAGYRRARNRAQYDVAPDDQRFIMIKDPPAPPIPTVVLVENWFPELLAKVKP